MLKEQAGWNTHHEMNKIIKYNDKYLIDNVDFASMKCIHCSRQDKALSNWHKTIDRSVSVLKLLILYVRMRDSIFLLLRNVLLVAEESPFYGSEISKKLREKRPWK